MHKYIAIGFLLILISNLGVAQRDVTLTLKNATVLNNNTLYTFDVFARSTGASTIMVGTSSLFFNYNSGGLDSPSLTNINSGYTGDSVTTAYAPMRVGIIGGKIGITIRFTGNGTGLGTTLSDASPDGELICTVNLDIVNMAQTAGLSWDDVNSAITDFRSLSVTNTTTGTDNSPLPITLASLNAVTTSEQSVRISWITLSEIHNYGFWVQRSSEKATGFTSLDGSFQAGHGTTTAQHSYSYTDATGSVNYYYRLQQVDLDGTSHYSEVLQPSGTTDVEAENVPRVFQLHQNYPNPFNPSTEIKFTVEKAAPTTLKVYNMLGQEVATLFNGIAQPGRYYTLKFSAADFASGMYIYRLESSNKSAVAKMLLLK